MRPLLLRQTERAGVRDRSEESPGSHVCCSGQRRSTRRAVERELYRSA